MSSNYVFVGDVGTVLLFDVGIDTADIISAKIYYQKPDSTSGYWDATLVASSTQIKYIIQSGDFNIAGTYTFQPWLELADWSGYGTTSTLKVYDHI